MNAKHCYKPGCDPLCADFALSGYSRDFAYAVVCGGSTLSGVELGAKAVAYAAVETLNLARSTALSAKTFIRMTMNKAAAMHTIFPSLPARALDVSLSVVWVYDQRLTAVICGDGTFFHRVGDTVRAVHVTSSPTDYPAYLLSEDRRIGYWTRNPSKGIYDCLLRGTEESGDTKRGPVLEPVMVESTVCPGEVAAVCTPGITSFQREGQPVSWQMLADQITRFEDWTGNTEAMAVAAVTI